MPSIPRANDLDCGRPPDGTRFVVRADEKLIAFLELAWPIRLDAKGDTQIVFPEES
jgi:hypothetical protein